MTMRFRCAREVPRRRSVRFPPPLRPPSPASSPARCRAGADRRTPSARASRPLRPLRGRPLRPALFHHAGRPRRRPGASRTSGPRIGPSGCPTAEHRWAQGSTRIPGPRPPPTARPRGGGCRRGVGELGSSGVGASGSSGATCERDVPQYVLQYPLDFDTLDPTGLAGPSPGSPLRSAVGALKCLLGRLAGTAGVIHDVVPPDRQTIRGACLKTYQPHLRGRRRGPLLGGQVIDGIPRIGEGAAGILWILRCGRNGHVCTSTDACVGLEQHGVSPPILGFSRHRGCHGVQSKLRLHIGLT